MDITWHYSRSALANKSEIWDGIPSYNGSLWRNDLKKAKVFNSTNFWKYIYGFFFMIGLFREVTNYGFESLQTGEERSLVDSYEKPVKNR